MEYGNFVNCEPPNALIEITKGFCSSKLCQVLLTKSLLIADIFTASHNFPKLLFKIIHVHHSFTKKEPLS